MTLITTSLTHLLFDQANSFFISALAGVLPALLWLVFWLKEDDHPEPRMLIFISFLFGAICVPIVLPIQYFFSNLFVSNQDIGTAAMVMPFTTVLLVFIWASSEEILKYIASHITKFTKVAIDEPLDWIMYLISTALGFAAIENTLFILSPVLEGNIAQTVTTGNLRFVGATLVHVVSSATIGVFLAFAFYKSKKIQNLYRTVGILVACLLHTAFNLFIIFNDQGTLVAFVTVWIVAIGLIFVIEKIKHINSKQPAC